MFPSNSLRSGQILGPAKGRSCFTLRIEGEVDSCTSFPIEGKQVDGGEGDGTGAGERDARRRPASQDLRSGLLAVGQVELIRAAAAANRGIRIVKRFMSALPFPLRGEITVGEEGFVKRESA